MGRLKTTNQRLLAVILTLALMIGLGLLNLAGVKSATSQYSDQSAFRSNTVNTQSVNQAGMPWWKQPPDKKVQLENDMPWGVGGIRD